MFRNRLNERGTQSSAPRAAMQRNRKGAFLVLAFFTLVGVVSFVALNVDIGVISLTRTKMQNAVDAAALAAAHEITSSVENVGNAGGGGGDVSDANSIATEAARLMAAEVASLNGIYVDPERDVRFGKRVYNQQSGEFDIQWDVPPFNVVEVTALKTNPSAEAPDAALRLLFAPFFGKDTQSLTASAIAYVEARDIVLVLDFSGSMSYDSQFRSDTIGKLGKAAVEDNLRDIWSDLGNPNWGNMTAEADYITLAGQPASGSIPHIKVTWKGNQVYVVSTKDLSNVVLEYTNGNTQKFEGLSGKTGTFKGTGGNSNRAIRRCWVKSGSNSSGDGPGYGEKFDFSSTSAIRKALGLSNVSYPFPAGSWDEYFDHVVSSSDLENYGYAYKFGGMTFIDYLLKKRRGFSETPVLWKTRHYPFHAMKEGTTLFTEFLQALDFGDHIGLVSYADTAQVETTLTPSAAAGIFASVDISGEPITGNYSAINLIQIHKQAAHYTPNTGMGYGIKEARELLQNHGRYGARQTILLMTDGNANKYPSGWKLPSSFNWKNYTDFDGDGWADYSTNDKSGQYAFYEAMQAVKDGYMIHTLAVGAGADRDLMRAIAKAGGGHFIDVPGGSTVAEMEQQMLAAFGRVAANVPPARLLVDPDDLD